MIKRTTALLLAALLACCCVLPVLGADTPSLEDFSKAKIGTTVGSVQDQIAHEVFPEAEILCYTAAPDVTAALLAGQIDCMISNNIVAGNAIAKQPWLAQLEDRFHPASVCAVFPKGGEKEELRRQLNGHLASLWDDGTLDMLYDAWLVGDPPEDFLLPSPDLHSGANPKLTVAVCSELEPLTFMRNGELMGYEPEIIRSFCGAYGYDLELIDIPFTSIILSVNSGQCDFAMAGMLKTPERAESADFSDSYLESYSVLVYSTGRGHRASFAESFEKTFIREDRWKMVVQGLGVTLLITMASGLLGTLLGACLCLMRRKGGKAGELVGKIYVQLFQGMPILVVLLIFYYVVFAGSHLPSVLIAIVVFALNSAAFFSECFLSGIAAVPDSQREAALALGFRDGQAFREFILPQAAAQFLPVYRGEFVTLLKGTSIVGYVAIQDLTKVGDIIRSRTFDAIFPLLAVAAVYFLLAWLLTLLIRSQEQAFRPVPGGHHLQGVVLRGEKGVDTQ